MLLADNPDLVCPAVAADSVIQVLCSEDQTVAASGAASATGGAVDISVDGASDGGGGGSDNNGAIIGGAVAGAVLLVLLAIALVVLRRRKATGGKPQTGVIQAEEDSSHAVEQELGAVPDM